MPLDIPLPLKSLPMQPVREPAKLGFDASRLARIKPWMQRSIDHGLIPGAATLIARGGELAYFDCAGFADVEAHVPWRRDTIARIYSNTKPITSIALMALYEAALVHLDDPLETFLPEFKHPRVLVPGATSLADTVAAKTPVTIRHLLTHTSGLSYGIQAGLLGEAYAKDGLGGKFNYGGLDKMVKRIAELPLDCEPGTRWHYSVGIDVIGRIIEVISGQSLDRFLAARIFEPLGMTETAFEVPDKLIGRYAALYTAKAGGGMQLATSISGSGGNGGPALAGTRWSIHDVVMDERKSVEQLDRCGGGERLAHLPADGLTRKERECGPKPFAARRQDVAHRFIDRRRCPPGDQA